MLPSHLHVIYSLFSISVKHYPSCAAGLTVIVLQPGDQVSNPEDSVTLECSMGPEFNMGSYTMFWYRQTHHGAPVEFIIREYGQTDGHFQSSLKTTQNRFTLVISELLLNDSSTYYCAASHSDAHRADRHTNNKSDCHRWHTGRKELRFTGCLLKYSTVRFSQRPNFLGELRSKSNSSIWEVFVHFELVIKATFDINHPSKSSDFCHVALRFSKELKTCSCGSMSTRRRRLYREACTNLWNDRKVWKSSWLEKHSFDRSSAVRSDFIKSG